MALYQISIGNYHSTFLMHPSPTLSMSNQMLHFYWSLSSKRFLSFRGFVKRSIRIDKISFLNPRKQYVVHFYLLQVCSLDVNAHLLSWTCCRHVGKMSAKCLNVKDSEKLCHFATFVQNRHKICLLNLWWVENQGQTNPHKVKQTSEESFGSLLPFLWKK